MPFSFFIANRFTGSRRNSRFISLISVISVVGIAIGVATMIIAITIINGFEKVISDKIIQFNSHIQITAFSNKSLPDYRVVEPVLKRKIKPFLSGISPFSAGLAIIRSKNGTEGVTVKGIIPEFNVYELGRYIKNGELDLNLSGTLPPIIIGNKLAEKLFIKVGDKITIFSAKNAGVPSPENPPSIKQFIVKAIFESGMAEYDDQYCYINIKSAQDIFGLGSNINGYDIKLNDITKTDSIAENLTNYLGYPYNVKTIFKLYQNIFTWIDLQKKLVPIALVLIVLVAVFNIIGTLLMIVLERSNAIGILKTLGAKRKQIMSVFLLQGIYLSIAGIALGNLLAFLLSKLQDKFDIVSLPESVYFMSKAPILIQWSDYALVSITTLLLCLLAAAIPSYIASKVTPISALRFD